MKYGRIIALMIIMTLAVLTVPSCKSGSQAELSPARLACIEMMQKMPVYYEDFEFWDVGILREDPDLREMYQIWYERKIEFLEQNYGLQGNSIDYFAQGEGLLDIIKANYDAGALRDRINVDFYRDTSHEDMEVWKSEPSHDPQSVTGGWVISEGFLVRGANNSNIDDYLRVATGEELSMYDKNASELLKRLPEGVMMRISRSPYPEGLIVSGMSIEKEANNTLKWTNIYKFESVEAAGSPEVDEYFKKIEEDFTKAQTELTQRGGSSPFHDFSLERDGEFIQWSMSIETKYMIAMLFYG